MRNFFRIDFDLTGFAISSLHPQTSTCWYSTAEHLTIAAERSQEMKLANHFIKEPFTVVLSIRQENQNLYFCLQNSAATSPGIQY